MKTRSVVAVVVSAIIVAFILKILLLDVMRVQGHSMEPTLTPGVVLFVDRWAFGIQAPFVNSYLVQWGGPKRNSLVVFRNPLDGILVVKRCIGLQGDPVKVENNTLTIGNRTVPVTPQEARRFRGYHRVPKGTIFALGDNVKVSEDSRMYGFIPVNHLMGRVVFHTDGNAAGVLAHG